MEIIEDVDIIEISDTVVSTGTATRLSDLVDVDVGNLSDGSILVYSDQSLKFESTLELRNNIIDGGNF
jgi:hypothetical protein